MSIRRLLACTFLVVAACSRATSSPLEARIDQTVDLVAGEAAQVENSAVVVRFAGVNDSRCPSDVVCVTAGDAAIALLLTGAGPDRAETIYLMREPKAVTYSGYRFEAVGVAPYPRSTGQGGARTLTMRITRAP